jgi:hypothetical protein
MQYWLQQQKLSGQIADIEIQLFDGRFALQNFTIHQGKQQKLKLGTLIVQIDPIQLFDRKIVLQQFTVNDLTLQVEGDGQKNLTLAGIPLSPTKSTPPAKSMTTPYAPWQVQLKNIDLARINSCYQAAGSRKVCASLQQLGWQGEFNFSLQPNSKQAFKPQPSQLSLQLTDFLLDDKEQNITLASFKQLLLNNIALQDINHVKIESVTLDDIAALQRGQTQPKAGDFVLQGKQLLASHISVADHQKITLDKLEAQTLKLTLQRQKEGTLLLKSLLAPYHQSGEASPVSKPPADNATLPMTIELGLLSLDDQSSFHFIDQAVTPSSQIDLKDIQLQLRQIDTASKANVSPVKIGMVVGENGKLQLQGSVTLLAQRPTLKLEGDIKGLNVSDFNAYTQQAIQHYVKSGHLDAKTSINIDQGQLDSNTELTLHQFYVEPISEQESEQYKEQVGLPLGTALSLLRDRDNSIRLELPVTGDINAPDFSINDVMRKVTGKALKVAVINYYSPLGMLSLAGSLFDLATALRFEPIEFDTGNAKLDDDDRERLDKLVGMLKERPHIHLVICGVSTQADRRNWFGDTNEFMDDNADEAPSKLPSLSQEQLEKLNTLAKERSQVVKEYLLKQKIDADRLIICTPKHQPGDSQPPRTELQL